MNRQTYLQKNTLSQGKKPIGGKVNVTSPYGFSRNKKKKKSK